MDQEFVTRRRKQLLESAARKETESRHSDLLGAVQQGNQLLSTIVGQDPRVIEFSQQLVELLEAVKAASGDLRGSGLALLPDIHHGLVDALHQLPEAVAATDKAPELIPHLQQITTAIRAIRVSPKVSVQAPDVDLSPLEALLRDIRSAMDKETDQPDTALEDAVKDVEKAVRDLIRKPIPVPTIALPPMVEVSGAKALPIANPDGTAIGSSGGVEKASSATISRVATSTTSAQLLAANASRKKVMIVNDGGATLYIKYGTTATSTSYSYKLAPDDTLEEVNYTGRIDGILASGTGNAQCTEL